jgi:hypothetical protein
MGIMEKKSIIKVASLLCLSALLLPTVSASVQTFLLTDMSFSATSGSSWDFSIPYSAGWTSGQALLKTYEGKAYMPRVYFSEEDEQFKIRVNHWSSYGDCDHTTYVKFEWWWLGNLVQQQTYEFTQMDSWRTYDIPDKLVGDVYMPATCVKVTTTFKFTSINYSQDSNGFSSVQYEII